MQAKIYYLYSIYTYTHNKCIKKNKIFKTSQGDFSLQLIDQAQTLIIIYCMMHDYIHAPDSLMEFKRSCKPLKQNLKPKPQTLINPSNPTKQDLNLPMINIEPSIIHGSIMKSSFAY